MMQVDILGLLSQHIGPWSNNWQDHKLSSSLGSLSIRYWSLLCGTLKVPNCWFLFLRVSPRHQRVTRKSGSLFRTPLQCSHKFGKFLFSDEYLYPHVRHWARRVTIAPIHRFVGEWTSLKQRHKHLDQFEQIGLTIFLVDVDQGLEGLLCSCQAVCSLYKAFPVSSLKVSF